MTNRAWDPSAVARGLAGLLLFATMHLAGCGMGQETPETDELIPSEFPTAEPGTIVWAVEAAPASLDPGRIIQPGEAQIGAQIFDRLVRYRPGTAQLAPGIAENWEADLEGRTFTFTLRPGLTFHDGTPLDARAVVWNFQRWSDPEHPFHRDDFLAWQALLETGETESEPTGLLQRVEALDAQTVRMTLNTSFAPFLHVLALVPFGMSSPEAVRSQGENYATGGDYLPVGSGPFRAVAWLADGAVRLVPFDNYWGDAPTAPGLVFAAEADPVARVAAIAEGKVHGTDLPPAFPMGEHESPQVEFDPRPARSTAWLILNHSRPPFDDPRVREAVSLAVDRVPLAGDRFGPFALPAGQMLPEGFLGHVEDLTAKDRDLERAKQLLAEAGAAGTSVTIWAPNQSRPHLPDPSGTAESLAAMLREAGIDAGVRTVGLRQFLSDRERGRYSAWILGWEAQTADPDNFWFFHFWSGRMVAEGHYDNPDLSQSLLRAQRSLSADERRQIYEEAARTVDRDTARIFLVHTRPIVALNRRVAGYRPGPMGFDNLTTVSLRPAPAGTAIRADTPTAETTLTVTSTGTITATTTVTATEAVTATTTVTATATDGGP